MLVLAGLVSSLSLAQSPAFDVASLKPVQVTGETFSSNLGATHHGELILTNVTLSDCLRFAYSITNDAQIAGPDWIRNKDIRFDILAKAPPDTRRDQLLLRLRTLLDERFKLKLHRERRELSFLALTLGRNGPKMPPANDDAARSSRPQIPGRINSGQMSMLTLTTLFSRFLRQTVLDQTGLTGYYDIDLQWTPDNAQVSDAERGPSLYTAVQQQLGLKLESRKAPIEVLVVDEALHTPLAN